MKTTIVALLLSISILSFSQTELKRKASLGFSLQKMADLPGGIVSNIAAGSPAQKSGLQNGDRILSFGGVTLTDENVMLKAMRKARGGEIVKLTVLRKGLAKPTAISFVPLTVPFESHNNLLLETPVVTNDYGDNLRAFVTKPKQASGKLPAILFVSWLSCSTVELNDFSDGWVLMLRDVAEKSGCLMLRIEKPGVSDSDGPPCSDCDLTTELNGYQAALRYLKSRPDVDTTKIILMGGSLGGTLTSIVGKGHNIKAYVSAVSVYKTWLEHMIELERRRLQLSGKNEAEASQLMQGYFEFHTDYLAQQKTPAQVLQQKPHLASLWYDEPAHQYGRPAAFYHQVQRLNFMESWGNVNVPVLLVAGEHDWIMSLDDNRLLNDMLNKKKPGTCTLMVANGMNHHWMKFKSAQDAFDEVNGNYDNATVAKMIEWIKEVVK